MMKQMISMASILLASALMVGCSSATSANDSTAAAHGEPSPTPTIDPGPVELTKAEAAERYLKLVCPNNFAADALAAAFDAGEAEFLAGGAPDPTAAKAAAAARIELNRATVALLDDVYYLWPDEVKDQIPHIRNSYMGELTTLNSMANASSFEDAYYAPWPAAPAEQEAAAQEIRYQLGLDADTTASCSGYEKGIEELTEEKAAREAALAG